MNDLDETLLAMHDSLASFAKGMFPRFEFARHLHLVVDALERVAKGTLDRLILTMPPRHSKSFLTSWMFPPWFLGHFPHKYVISTSYGEQLSTDFGGKVRDIFQSELYQKTFPNARLKRGSRSVERLNLAAGGAYYSVGIGASITGRGADALLIDDPLKSREEAESVTIRRKLIEWYQAVAYTRLMPGGAIVILSTRWHENDLIGWILENHAGDGWEIINMPAIAEEDEGWRKEGEALWPEHYPLESLARIKRNVGSAEWASLYQQRPSAKEGNIYKREWWWCVETLPEQFEFILQVWDTAFKTKRKSSRSACTTWGVYKDIFYLIDVWSGKVEFPDLQKKVEMLAGKWGPHLIIVEDQASGQALHQNLKRTTKLPIKPYSCDGDKIARANSVTAIIEAGGVFMPKNAPWVKEFIDEMAMFPNGNYDDVADTVSMGIDFLMRRKTKLINLNEKKLITLPRSYSIFQR